MNLLSKYIEDTLGISVRIKKTPRKTLGVLPLYITEIYDFQNIILFDTELVFITYKNENDFKVKQTQKNIDLIKRALNKKVVLIIRDLEAYNRKRLIEKGINFIMPNKQMFMPDLLIDLKETKYRNNRNVNKLLPSAQFLLVFHFIHTDKSINIENLSFKEMAQLTGYTAMAISKAVENLKTLGIITVNGTKEKSIQFNKGKSELWHSLINNNSFINPVAKTVFVDEKPKNLLYCNSSALPIYTDINPINQEYLAISKEDFYTLRKNNSLKNLNNNEGEYCLEVWKYNPEKLVPGNNNHIVDPLSLYLSLRETKDERIELALEQIIKKRIW